ncbi:hypothetical protein [Crocinitomix algicola]|uniref:hypothetical protein n=1 Tax=Crocinitomix algicola TaxID=1740263 RepID=UPI001112FF78|nr:hypothetical protein [Crocinitomix algicola]
MNRLIAKAGLFLLAGVLVTLTSCRKEADTIAKVEVVDTANVQFPNAMVRLYATSTIEEHGSIIIDDTLFTDATGYATFNYSENYNLGQAGVFVLDIEVRSGDTLTGTGVIKVEQETTSEETVIIQ